MMGAYLQLQMSPSVLLVALMFFMQGHGKFSVGEKGCGAGISGTNDKAVEVHGIFAFSQLRQCNTSGCNVKLDIQALQLQPMGNFSLTKPVKGCVQDGDCTKVRKGSNAITLSGSCCSGNLCNTNLSNKTHFSTSIPRPAFLPAEETKNATATTPPTYVRVNAATVVASTSSKITRSLGVSPSVGGPQKDHGHDHDHDHDHDHSHEEDENNVVVQNRKVVPSVQVEERKVGGPKGGVAGLQGSLLVTLVLLGLSL
ncbi:PREDICTED: ly6/PLAUR domain-containing protein 3 [Thamnophis sirtalis]|uniref:Ly6/PLAUR domain-containing protein 3 n=1 Tax=Thamnophis sirtalis TaxID=35019 RepID=A0A6I9XKD7_9SAUR|nr:PREDICTED: ly6/PLAUR domain-containing protein 3 [Thamnophis sirtalis]